MKKFLLMLLSVSAWGQAQQSYTWYDDEAPRQVWIDPAWVARIEYPKTKQSAPRVTFIRVTKDKSTRKLEPVFRNAKSGGSRMVMPGNILVRFDKEMTAEAVQQWVTGKNSEVIEKIAHEPNTYIITSIPGLASLELANRARGDEHILGAEPIWWTEVEKK